MASTSRRDPFVICLVFLSTCYGQDFFGGGNGGGVIIEHSGGFRDGLSPGEMMMDSGMHGFPGEFIPESGPSHSFPGEVISWGGTREMTRPSSTQRYRSRQNTRMSRVRNTGDLQSMMTDMMRNFMSRGGQGNFRFNFVVRSANPTTRRQPLTRSRSSERGSRDLAIRQPRTYVRESRTHTYPGSFDVTGSDPFSERERPERFQGGEWGTNFQYGGRPSPPHPPPSRPTGNGGHPGRFGLTRAHVQQILDEHNKARRELNAADMYKMHWDDQLAVEANEWIQRCEMSHKGYGGRGENLAMVGGYGMDTNAVVNYGLSGWYNEKKLWNYGDRFSSETGHYTQMIWASSRLVGCAAKTCQGNTLYFFCFYSPQGNIMGRNPYQRGTPCSQCRGTCRNGLCD